MLNIFYTNGRSKGYINWVKVFKLCKLTPFIFSFGGRGTGKTYGVMDLLTGLRGDDDFNPEDFMPFVFMRRRAVELDACFSEGADDNPFYQLEEDYNVKFYYVAPKTGKNGRPGELYWGKYEEVEDKKGNVRTELVPDLDRGLICYTTALSSFAGVRGFGGFTKCKAIVYDEYIKESIVHKMRGEFEALMNAYESINRNREFPKKDAKGNDIPGTEEPPVKFIGLANANDITNDYFVGLKVVKDVQKMVSEGKPFKQWIDKGLTIINIGKDSPISQKKKHTALYRLTEGTEFYKMAIENKFNEDDSDIIKPQDLRNYDPICASAFYGFTVYKRRGKEIHDGKNLQMYYVSDHLTERDVRRFGKGKAEKERFLRTYTYLWYAYIESRVIFEDYLVLEFFHRMFDMSEE